MKQTPLAWIKDGLLTALLTFFLHQMGKMEAKIDTMYDAVILYKSQIENLKMDNERLKDKVFAFAKKEDEIEAPKSSNQN